MLRYFCISCEKPICAECIVDHSGHEFVRREESLFVIKETAANIKKILDESQNEGMKKIMKAENAINFLDKKKDYDLKKLEKEYKRIIVHLEKRKNSVKDQFLKLIDEEKNRITTELANY